MSLLERFLLYILGEPNTIEHPFWGRMVDTGDHFECERRFEPKDGVVTLWLEKYKAETHDNQVDFFKWIEANYEELVITINPSVEAAVAEWIPNYKLENFRQDYDPVHLQLPQCVERPFEWRIFFYGTSELQHTVLIDLTDMEVTGIMIDG